MNLRELNPKLYHSCKVYEDFLWLPLWNLSGQLVGYQTYRPDRPKNDHTLKPSELKYYTQLSKEEETWYFRNGKTKTLKSSKLTAFGLDLLSRHAVLPKLCFLVEGVFDAVPFHNLGLNCLGLLGVASKPNNDLLNLLRSLGYHLVAVCEDDKAGKNLSKYADTSLYLENGQDPGDLKTEGVELFLKNNGYRF